MICFFEGMSYRQLSQKYNIPLATLQYQIKKILNKLKNISYKNKFYVLLWGKGIRT